MPVSSVNNDKPTIVVAILNWGLGHATRMIPVIEMLRAQGTNIILASSGVAGALLRERYGHLPYHELKDYNVKYSRSGSIITSMAKNWSSVQKAINTEHYELANLIKMEGVDAVISDNRYGCYSSEVPSIMVTHQVNPIVPGWAKFLQSFSNRQITKLLNKFDECWIPDFPNQELSGQLSNQDGLQIPSTYIGPLSRFQHQHSKGQPKNQWLAILSGPEPQRTILQEKFINACQREGKKGIIIAGQPDRRKAETKLVKIFPHLPDEEFQKVILESSYILMRPGYTSIMDFYQIGKNALLIPTPGQTEQQYLAQIHGNRQYFIVRDQNQINLSQAEEDISNLKPPEQIQETPRLKENIERLIDKILH